MPDFCLTFIKNFCKALKMTDFFSIRGMSGRKCLTFARLFTEIQFESEKMPDICLKVAKNLVEMF